MRRWILLPLLLLAACDDAKAPAAEPIAPTHYAPDPRDDEALKQWERYGGDPGEYFRHRIPTPDEQGAYPPSDEPPPTMPTR